MTRRRRGKNKWFGRVVLLALVAAAVITELRKPPEERTWHGKLAGLIPYELRKPTLERVVDTYWAPTDEHVLKPPVWGVGWQLNVGRVVALLRGAGSEPDSLAA